MPVTDVTGVELIEVAEVKPKISEPGFGAKVDLD